MAYEFEGKTIETTATGYLVNQDDWSRELAEHMASQEQIHADQPALGRHRLSARRVFQ